MKFVANAAALQPTNILFIAVFFNISVALFSLIECKQVAYPSQRYPPSGLMILIQKYIWIHDNWILYIHYLLL